MNKIFLEYFQKLYGSYGKNVDKVLDLENSKQDKLQEDIPIEQADTIPPKENLT